MWAWYMAGVLILIAILLVMCTLIMLEIWIRGDL